MAQTAREIRTATAWRRSGRRGGASRPARSRSSAGGLPSAAELQIERGAGEPPRLPEAVHEVTRVRLGDRLGAIGHDGEPGRRDADLRRVQEPYRLSHGLRRLLPVYQGLEYPVDLRRGHSLGALVRDLQDQLEELGHPLAGLGG